MHPAASFLRSEVLGLVSLVASAPLAACTHEETHEDEHAHWSYAGDSGPSFWGTLDPYYALCDTGTAQSPIDIPAATQAAPDPAFATAWTPGPITATDNGHALVITPASGSTTTFGAVRWPLAQFHFHAPSEHTIGGAHFPLEIHFVHQDADKRLAVLGVLVSEGSENAAMSSLASPLSPAPPNGAAVPVMLFDPTGLLPPAEFAAARAMWVYDGSLTTPPCSEGVAWHVLETPVTFSSAQIATVKAYHDGNSRPPQPLGVRTIDLPEE
jgi:carbonic anhydrase